MRSALARPRLEPFSLQHDDALEDFDQRSAWRLDYVLDLAESNGLAVMLCFESFNYLRKSDPYPSWDQTPYRAEAGGPISEPAEFFTNDEATRWFQNRLRYVIARVGHSPHVLSWQFWNEVDLTEGYDGDVVGAWHQEMAEFVKQIDVYGHLVTTSFANTVGDPRVWSVEELDYVQSHNYGAPDITDVMSHSSAKAELYGRPHMFGEFGADSMAGYFDQDTEGTISMRASGPPPCRERGQRLALVVGQLHPPSKPLSSLPRPEGVHRWRPHGRRGVRAHRDRRG